MTSEQVSLIIKLIPLMLIALPFVIVDLYEIVRGKHGNS